MGATTLIPVAEYLSTVYRPDVDYVDGVLEERNVGELDHSKVQKRLLSLFEKSGFEFAYAELRLRISPTRYRVPDVSVFLTEPAEQISATAPILAVEVLSPEDRLGRMQLRLDDYSSMGCPCVWLIDPQNKLAYVYVDRALVRVDELTQPAIPTLRAKLPDLI